MEAMSMLDQVLWLLRDERPARVVSFMRNDATPGVPALRMKETTRAGRSSRRSQSTWSSIDIASMEVQPTQRRFEVYGTRGSAVLDPMEPCPSVKLILAEDTGGFQTGAQPAPTPTKSSSRRRCSGPPAASRRLPPRERSSRV